MAKCMQCGGMKKATKMKLGGSAIKKAPVQLYGIPQENMGTSGQYGQMKKGGSTSVINRPVKPGCRGGMVKDANGNCVEVRKAKKGMNFKDLSGDGKITRKDVLIGRRVIPKKANGGPILDKIKEKLAAAKAKSAERKITKQIRKSVKSSGKIVK